MIVVSSRSRKSSKAYSPLSEKVRAGAIRPAPGRIVIYLLRKARRAVPLELTTFLSSFLFRPGQETAY
jgi:hypothetical protein